MGILDAADGTVLVDLRSDGQHQTTALKLAWEDDEHALLVTCADGQWAVVRFGLDGTMEYAVPPRPRQRLPTAVLPTVLDGHQRDGLGGVGGQVERRRGAPAGDQLCAERRDHGAVVGAQTRPGDPDPDVSFGGA